MKKGKENSPIQVEGVRIELFLSQSVEIDSSTGDDLTEQDSKGKHIGLLIVSLSE